MTLDRMNGEREKKESNFESIKYFYKKIGFKLLLNDAEPIKKNKDELAIIGVENWGNPPFPQKGDLDLALKDLEEIPSS